MNIRPVTNEDYPASMMLIAEFAEESLSEYGTYLDPERLEQTYKKVMPTSFCLIVEGKLVGVFGGHIVEDFCSKRPVYEEVIWYVKKDKRKYGIKLLRYVEEWCKANRIERITMCCMHNSQTEKLWSLYTKLGFRPMETRFIKEIDNG